MSEEALKILQEQLIRHEGVRLKPYRCSAGKLTIGIGRNLDDVGITAGEADAMLRNDIERVRVIPQKYITSFSELSAPRQAALINMVFNLGEGGFSNFKNMIAAINEEDFETAADEMLSSRWADQVGKRAQELAAIIKGA